MGNKKMVFWFVRVDDEGYPEIARCTEWVFATILAGISAGGMYCPECGTVHWPDGVPPPSDASLFADIFQQGNRFVRGGSRSGHPTQYFSVNLRYLVASPLLYKINQLSSHCEFICTASDASEKRVNMSSPEYYLPPEHHQREWRERGD
ncbi:hypothetical protein FEZ19_005187 [Escherichia coli]|nr:hypothetical protein [Escherichia coli]